MTMVTTLRPKNPARPDTNWIHDIKWKQHPRDCVGISNLRAIEQETDAGTSPGALDHVKKCRHAQIHEDRQEATSEHFSARDDDDDGGREGEERQDVKLKDQCLILAHTGGSYLILATAKSLTDPSEQKMTPQNVFDHLQQLDKLYKNGALTEEQYSRSRERLWTTIAVGPSLQSPPIFCKTDKSRTNEATLLELHYLDRLLQLCQDGAITEKQYNRARDRINGQQHVKEEEL